jgi:pilus assembly protein CpaE
MATKILLTASTQDGLIRLTRTVDHKTLESGDAVPKLGDVSDLIAAIADGEYGLIVADLRDLDDEGLQRLDQPLSVHSRTAVVIIKQAASADFLLQAMRTGVREVIVPESETALAAAVSRHVARLESPRQSARKGRLIAMMPAKGGSGATFLAANLGYALAQRGKRVALIDMNLQFGDTMLYLSEKHPATNIATLARESNRLDRALLEASMAQVSENLWVLGSPDSPEQSVLVTANIVDQILSLAREHFDFVLLDVGRILEAVTVHALDDAESVYLVLQATLPALHDTRRLITVLNGLGYGREKISVVINRAEKNSEIGAAEIAKALGYEVSVSVPNSFSSVLYSINHGIPIIRSAPKDPVTKALQDWAAVLAPAEGKRAGGWLRGVFGSLA